MMDLIMTYGWRRTTSNAMLLYVYYYTISIDSIDRH